MVERQTEDQDKDNEKGGLQNKINHTTLQAYFAS